MRLISELRVRGLGGLDSVRLEDLQKIATGSTEQKRVQAIKDRSPAPLVNPMTAHKSSRL